MYRKVKTILKSQPTIEGAGVRLRRVFGYPQVPLLDPFLLLDHFGSDNSDDYIAGFPWHPHRGIETVTYMLAGEVEHADSIGNKGVIKSGDVQWMTAGNGIIHQEMPRRFEGKMRGFQLWVNLPASHKMMDPRYRDSRKDMIPEFSPNPKVNVKVISGAINGVKGPVQDLVVETEYLDITIDPFAEFEKETMDGNIVFAYIFEGSGYFDQDDKSIQEENLVIFSEGNKIKIRTTDEPIRFILVSGKPLNEPIAWRGPIVMNTDKEIENAFQEIRNQTFLKG